ncbi:MAG: iron ABC transporter permease, partial [Planctomycetes bacterium]|nr:iron ABC transporter permease [Planctomycetota bacterium]
AALAIAGTLMQAVFRNPLASPEILGTAQGSALGATVAIVLGLNSHWAPMLPICAIVGALAVTAVVYGIAGGTRGFSVGSLLLAGIAMNTLVGALISFAISSLTYDDWGQGSRILFWLMGDFDKTTAQAVVTVGVVLVVVAGCLLPFLRDMDVMTLEGESARALGVHVPLVRSVLLAAACVLTAVTVAFTGGIAFVGLVVPHMARLIVGPRHRAVVPSAAVLGGVFLVAADYLCRVVVPQSGLRVGVVMSMIGAPFFFYLLVRMRRDRPL